MVQLHAGLSATVACRLVAELLRRLSVEMPEDHQTEAMHWLAEVVDAAGQVDIPDMIRCAAVAADLMRKGRP